MTKIYEALDNASRDQQEGRRQIRTGAPVSTNVPKGLEGKLLSLCRGRAGCFSIHPSCLPVLGHGYASSRCRLCLQGRAKRWHLEEDS